MAKIIECFSIVLAILLIGFIIYSIFFQVKENMKQNDPVLKELVEMIQPLHPIVKDIEFYEDNRSYTINKEKVYMCLKDKEGNYYHKNALLMVLIHEISHVLCPEIGHTDKFNDIFQDLLAKATELGIYNPSIPMIQDYCNY
jgi:hypothetical protein